MLYFIRHGQTDWNLNNLVQGKLDKPDEVTTEE